MFQVKCRMKEASLVNLSSKAVTNSFQHSVHCRQFTTAGSSVKNIKDYLTVADFESECEQRLNHEKLAYLSSGADGETTLKRNTQIWDTVMLKPRICVDVTSVKTQSSVFGRTVEMPLWVAPTGLNKLFHADGEAELAKACGQRGIPHMISSFTDSTWEEIREKGKIQSSSVMWYQVYFDQCKQLMIDQMGQALELGCSSIFVTVDCPFCGKRVSDQRTGAAFGLNHSGSIDPSVTWDSLSWLKQEAQKMKSDIRFGIKGVQCGEDALLAIQYCDVDAIVVSNHGGRQLDTVPSSMEMLIDVVSAIDDYYQRSDDGQESSKVHIMLDGGIRKGSDIFKALCLGAHSVGIGRPALYGLFCEGETGVNRVFDILHEELDLTMKLVGCVDIKDASPKFLW